MFDEKLIKVPNVGNCANKHSYSTVQNNSSNLATIKNRNSEVLAEEEIKICEMEIELLQKKLKYYKSQLEFFDNNDSYNWRNMIRGIERQLYDKVNELNMKRTKRQTNLNIEGRNNHYESVPVNRLSKFERIREHIDQQLNNLNMLSEKDDSLNIDESRLSLSTVKSNITIPNEYESKMNTNKKIKLSQMMEGHKMINKHITDFGQSPEK